MPDLPLLTVIVPTRGRPQNAKRLKSAPRSAKTDLLFIVDTDDPARRDYIASVGTFWSHEPTGHPGIVPPLNRWAVPAAMTAPEGGIVGFMGDDHLPRTLDWDVQIIETLGHTGTGIAYGNDLVQGELLPTAVFMTADIIRRLGYMAPPALRHLYVDNYWRDLGQGAGCLTYLPDVIIEHLHYSVGASEEDETYRNANSPNVTRDRDAYRQFINDDKLLRDIDTVKGLL